MSRTNELLAAVDSLLAIHADWADGDAPMSEEFASAVDDTIEVFADGDLPADCRQVAAIVLGLEEPWEAYKIEAAAQDDPQFLPPQSFWDRIAKLRDARIRKDSERRFSLEKIPDLVAQKVSPAQICRMYGFVDDQGREQLWKLEEEIDRPGTHTNRSQGWLPPQERRHREKLAKSEEALQRLQQRMGVRINRAKHLQAPCPEPWEELLQSGLSAEQIATMKRCGVDEVYATADELGINRPPRNYNDSLAAAEIVPVKEEAVASLTHGANRANRTEPPETAADLEATDEEMNEFIVSMIDQDLSDLAIKEAVTEKYGRSVDARRIKTLRKTLEAAK